MSNTEASEENIKSPSKYGEKGYREYRKKEKIKKKKDPEEGLNRVTNYSKYAVGENPKKFQPQQDQNKISQNKRRVQSSSLLPLSVI